MNFFLLTLLLIDFSYLKAENFNKAIHFFFEAEYSLLSNQMIAAGRNYEKATNYSPSQYIHESSADFFLSIGNYKKAIKFYSHLNSLYPSNYNYIKGLYNSLMALEKYNDAETLINSSSQYNIERLSYLVADFHYTLENWDNLLDSYTEILLKYPNERSILKEMFLIASISQNTNRLRLSLDRLWSTYKDVYILKALIRLSFELSDYKETLRYLDHFHEYHKQKDFIIMKSQSLIELGQHEKALEILKEYRGLADEKIYSMFINIYHLIDDRPNHLLYCKKSINQFPNLELGYREIIRYYIKLEKYAKALSVAIESKKKFKSTPAFNYMEAEIYFFNNKYNLALESFIEAKRRGLNSIEIEIKIGYCYEEQGKTLLSDSLFANLIEKNPQDASIMNNYAYTISERDNQSFVDLRHALNLSRRANIIEPNNAAFLDTLGWIYYKLEYYNNALSVLKESIKRDKHNPVIWEHLADVYIKVGENDKALECYKKALDYDKENFYLVNKINKYE